MGNSSDLPEGNDKIYRINPAQKTVPKDFQQLPAELLSFEKPLGLPAQVYYFLTDVLLIHYCFIHFGYLLIFGYISRWTLLPVLLFTHLAGFGVTMSSHRYYSHRTYKANKKLQIILMIFQTMNLQGPLFDWSRDHRVHHKYTDTDADPYNATKGFWHSHILWKLKPRHPDCVEASRKIDISDLANDPIIIFQSKYYFQLVLIFSCLLPMAILHYLFPEMTIVQLFVTSWAKNAIVFHLTASVNSVAHMWGDRPYDRFVSPTDNKYLAVVSGGEGWHNYHHTFPWDYKGAEFGYKFNLSTLAIDFFAWIGWAWDLKTVSSKLLVQRINRTGDGSHPLHICKDDDDTNDDIIGSEDKLHFRDSREHNNLWGWGDAKMEKEMVSVTEVRFASKNKK